MKNRPIRLFEQMITLLMQGLVLEGKPVGEVVTKAIENGLLVISAGTNVLRMVPPLVITEADVDEMIEKLEKALV